MELRYPIFIPITIIAFSILFIIGKKKIQKYKDGSKIANTQYLKNTIYYKKIIRRYNFYKFVLYILFITATLSAAILLSRLSKVETINKEQYNRDIFLCMDASSSVDELNVELVDSLKKTVDKLHGERFGISIFNTSSVILVPLTDDYDYVKDILDEIKKSLKTNLGEGVDYNDDDYFYVRNYIYSGTLVGNEQRGSSLIGDGLASCVYSFSNLEDDRSRIIIFSTDNDLAGTPIVTLDKAGSISKSKNIKVFGIGTKIMKDKDRKEFKATVEKTGGKYYEHSKSTVNNIVQDIESTSKSLLKKQYETKKIDLPEVPFIILFISLIGIIVISKKVIM